MQKKIKYALIAVFVIFASIVMFNSKAEAATVIVSPSQTMYKINGSKRMYRYVESRGNHQNIYCLDYSGVLNNGTSYDVSSDIYNLNDSQIIEIFGSRENYNKSLWVIDNMFLSQNQSKDEMDVMVNQLKQALHSDIAIEAVRKTHNVPNFNAGNMDNVINHIYLNGWYNVFYSVNQCVLWNYTVNTYSFPGLKSLSGGYDLEGKYYMWMYTGLKAVADTKGNYNSPNRNGNVENTLNNLTMDSKEAKIDVQNKKIGPFIVNGYNSDIITKNAYTVKINNKILEPSEYLASFDGKNLYITIKNSNYDLSAVKVDISMNIIGIKTTGSLLYKQWSQDIVSLKKSTVPKNLTGSTEDTEFDLRLIKNIAEVWNTDGSSAIVKYDLNSDMLKSREIRREPTLSKGSTTEPWYTNKYPVDVASGDIVKYAITIANEGSLNGYATEVTDYIADGLELVSKDELVRLGILKSDDEYYGWSKGESSNGFTAISTTYLSNKEIKAYDSQSDTVDTKVIYIYCKVTSHDTGVLLKNVAEITADKTSNLSGQDVNDRDSTPENIKMSELSSSWKGNKGNTDILNTNINEQYYFPGKEDDDDFDTVRIQNFDLALTKEITAVTYSDGSKIDLERLISIDKSKLNSENNVTTASYNMNKGVVSVTKDSIVTYKISIYNEGSIDGFAKEITDYLPVGLEFYSSEVNGKNYNWKATKNEDGTTTITTDYLSNISIGAYANNTLQSQYVEVMCKVTSDQADKVLTNVAEITKYGYYAGNNFIEATSGTTKIDRDSSQKTLLTDISETQISNMIEKYETKLQNKRLSNVDKTTTNYEDDDDFERVKIIKKELDLALRKSISAVNGESTINGYNLTQRRLPYIDVTSASAALSTGNAKYYHNKEAIEVKVNDEITYTIRVYNEGNENDYCGYAKEIVDYLPEGLSFVKIDEASKSMWETSTKEGDKTVILKYIGNETIYNNSLLSIYANAAVNNTDMTNLYQTVSIICKVNNVNGYLTNRAEIKSEVATDADGNIIEHITDRDSTPGSLKENDLGLDTYYKDYNRKYGINDTYIDYYPGEENNKKEDDVDFETVYIKELELTQVSGSKTWNDNGNQDGKRPDSIMVYLLANGKQVDAKEITEADGWKYSFTELEKYDDKGKEIIYTVDENEIEKYTKKIEGYNLINTYIPETVEVNGTKTWNDEGNQDGTRPEKLIVYLLADGKQIDSREITEKDGWKYSFAKLPKYNDGKEIVYTVDESEVEKYTKKIEGYNLINTYIPETVEVNGTKTWNDEGNQDGTRPEKLTVYLLADGRQIDSKEITEKDGWKYSFTKLPKYNGGKEIVYTVDESEVEKYTKKIEGYNLINTYIPETVEVNGTKTWNDEGNKDKTRPEKLTVYLLADGKQIDSKEITEKDGWKYSFTKLPKYNGGKEIVYTVDESEVEKYTKKIEGYNLINTYIPEKPEPETVEINGTKTWNDEGNKDKTRPEKITVYLLADGKQIDSKEITEKDGWKYSFTGLAKYDEKEKEIVYTIDESEVEKYTKKIEGYNLINTYIPENPGPEPETVEVNGTKTWNDEGNKDKTRPEKLTVYLLANGKQIDSKEITEKDGWKYSFTGLAKYDEKEKEIVYTIDESEVEKYTKKIEGYNLINTYIPEKPGPGPETVEIKGTKIWNDNDDDAGKRPKTIIVNLLANGTKINSTIITANENGTWEYSFTDLPKYENEKEIVYTVTEEKVEYYETKIEGYNLINTYIPDKPIPETVEVSGTKTWVDQNNKDKMRPEILRVYLLADGVKVDSVIISAKNNWKYSFTELAKYNENGKEIVYTIDEEEIKGYTKKIEGYNLINTHTIKEVPDLALRKFITEVNGVKEAESREPNVNVDDLANGKSTNATYTHPKNAVTVNTNDVVTYTLRIYNEGPISGYASLVKDDIPDGLEFIVNDSTNKEYGWEMLDENGKKTSDVSKAKYVVTNYLSKERNEANLLNPFNKETKTMDYKDVKVSFKVVSTDVTEKEIINYAQISEQTDSNGNKTTDRDSTPNKWIDGEDDQDIEKIKLNYLDFSLRKFITKVDGAQVSPSREPVVDITRLVNGSSTTATYTHPKDVVSVSKDDIITYTLRIYNEGTKSGYATLIKDDIPEGLEFVVNNETNKKYGWKMIDENGIEVIEASKAKYVVTDYLSKTLINAFDQKNLDYKDVEVAFRVIAPETSKKIMTNYAQISDQTDSNGNKATDRDSIPNQWNEGEDDQDIESVKLTYADLALRKFITELNNVTVNPSRVPSVDVTNLVNESSTNATYTHPKDPIEVREDDIVTYTLRVYNEGTKSVYASLVKDDIPNGLEFLPENTLNKEYKWKMLDENNNEVTDVSKAKYIITDYLAQDKEGKNLLKAFNPDTMTALDYRDVKVSFKVIAPDEKEKVITNYAQISKETDSNGNNVTDRDSTPNEWNEGEDDQDTEKVKVKYFDLALQKWVSKAIIIEDGKEKVIQTGHTGEDKPEAVVKVDLKKSKLNNVIIKFEYQIKVTNQGQISGYAEEVTEHIPNGLKFVAEDNTNWKEVNGKIVTNALSDTLLNPGESTTISFVLTWINKADNLGLKVNTAEISKDSDENRKEITDIDSTPDNNVEEEDDQDTAPTMITIKTGEVTMYTGIVISVISILGIGIFSIKKYVLK